MKLSKEAINEFINIYLNDYGISLSYQDAEKIALAHFNQMRKVYKSIPKEHLNC